MCQSRGFTLPELLISVLLLLILTSMAIPSFSRYLHHEKQEDYLNTLAETLQFAHLYALQHQTTITLCPSQNHQTCDTDWTHGGIIMTAQQIIGTFPAIPANETLTVLLFPNHPWVAFLPQGLASQSAGRFSLSDPLTHQTTTLILSNTGRLRFETEPTH
jgi:prepilin-type N-terminal cleavage/methylation domain-containing protein